MKKEIYFEVAHKTLFKSEKDACEYAAKIAQNISNDEIVEIHKTTFNPCKSDYEYKHMATLENYNGLLTDCDYTYLIDKYDWSNK